MKRKMLLIGILCMLALVVSGCMNRGPYGPWSSRGDRDPEFVPLNEFRTGSEGIELEFLRETFPDRITGQDTYTTIINVQNKGAADVEYGKVVLVSVDSIVKITPEVQEFGLKGKNIYFTEGEQYQSMHEVSLSGTGVGETTFIAYACYPYETKLVDTLCVDPSIGKAVIAEKACEMQGKSFGGGQGAPLVVDGVDIQPVLQEGAVKLRVNVSVRNAGGGKVVSQDISSAECSVTAYDKKLTPSEFIDVKVELADTFMKCTKLLDDINKKGELRGQLECTSGVITKQSATNSPFVVSLYYGYVSEQIVENVEIV